MLASGMPPFLAHGMVTLNHAYRAGVAAVPGCTVETVTEQASRTIDAYLHEHLALFQA
ncbi:MAG: hypothetical protein H0X24_08990 [Ktedonobacterales bacterium]|nr:hypothetical protein [Ktedonobacterales bacterium]